MILRRVNVVQWLLHMWLFPHYTRITGKVYNVLHFKYREHTRSKHRPHAVRDQLYRIIYIFPRTFE